jgi:Fur family transcriptional regulator, iron response regulator
MGPNMKPDVVRTLKEHGIQPSAQRVAVAEYVLHTPEHPSAEKVWARVRESFPMISRATVYNTLNLFVERGLLRELHLAPDSVLFDANTDRHHHFIDEESGRIYDVPWNQIEVRNAKPPPGFEVHAYQVVMRGCRRPP